MEQNKTELITSHMIGTYIEEIVRRTDGLKDSSIKMPELLGKTYVQLMAAWMKDQGLNDKQKIEAYKLLEASLRAEFVATLALLAVLDEMEAPHDLH